MKKILIFLIFGLMACVPEPTADQGNNDLVVNKDLNLPLVNIGVVANDGTGDPLRTAFGKVNQIVTQVNTNTADILLRAPINDATFTGLTILEQLKLGAAGVLIDSITSDGSDIIFWSGVTQLTAIPGTGSSTWGLISGSLINQLDLQATLDLKAPVSTTLTTSHAASGVTSQKIINWDLAYGWGSHATAGYALNSSLASYVLTTTLSGYVPTTRTVNGHALSSNVSVTTTDLSLQNVTNESKATMFDSPTFTTATNLPSVINISNIQPLPAGALPDTSLVLYNGAVYYTTSAITSYPNYYIDQISGSDDSTGLTPTRAWKTIAKVNAATLTPGTGIKFKRGCTWREQLNITSASGTSSQRIVYSAYGTGTKPIITGADVITGWGASYGPMTKVWGTVSPNATTTIAMVAIDDSLYTQVTTLAELTSARKYWIKTASNPDSIYLWSATDPDARTAEVSKRNYGIYATQTYITLSYLDVRMAGNKGILFNGQNSEVDGQTIIDSCIAYRNRFAGIGIYDGWGHATIRNSSATYNGNNFIAWGQQTAPGGGGAVSQNTVFTNCYSANSIHDYTVAGLYSDGTGYQLFNCNNSEIDHCISINDNTACYLDANQNTNQTYTVKYNNFSNTGLNIASYGIGINTDGAGCVSNIYYNIFNECGYADSAPIQLTWNYAGTVNFYNNTVYNSIAKHLHHQVFSLTGTGITFKNNIFHFTSNTDDYFIIWHMNTSGYITADYNHLYKSGVWGIGASGGNRYQTIASWRAASGQDANSAITDPLFTTNGSNFALQAGSPAINTGTVISGIPQLDIIGNPIIGLPDRGAYEKQ